MEAEFDLVIFIVGIVIALAAIMLRKSRVGRLAVPYWMAVSISSFALGLGLGCGAMHIMGYRWQPIYQPIVNHTGVAFPLKDVTFPLANDNPRKPGDQLPPLVAEGWLNIDTETSQQHANALTVIDVWADW